MLIDQHRAHIRVLFERYHESDTVRNKEFSQGVLFPGNRATCPLRKLRCWKASWKTSRQLGFELRHLWEEEVMRSMAVPSGIEGLNPVELVRSMVHTAMEKGNDVKEEVQTMSWRLTLAKCCCHCLRPGVEQ